MIGDIAWMLRTMQGSDAEPSVMGLIRTVVLAVGISFAGATVLALAVAIWRVMIAVEVDKQGG